MNKVFMILLGFNMWVGATTRSEYVASMRASLVDQEILSSPAYQACFDKFKSNNDREKRDEEVRKCLMDSIENIPDDELEALSGDLKISGIELEENQTTASLKDYLAKRIHDAIHGEGSFDNQKLENLKHVDQSAYFTLYQSQLHKNVTLEFTRYCLENLGGERPEDFVMFSAPDDSIQTINQQLKENRNIDVSLLSFETQSIASYNLSDKKFEKGDNFSSPPSRSISSREGFGHKIKEYNYCPSIITDESKKDNPCHKDIARDRSLVNLLKEYELKTFEQDPNRLGQRFVFCAKVAIPAMCEVFRCKNIYDKDADPNSELGRKVKYCNESLNISPKSRPKDSKSDKLNLKPDERQGQMACNVLNKISEYRKTLELVEAKIEELNQLRGNTGLLKVSSVHKKGSYGFGQGAGEKSIDEITSISSQELSQGIEQYGLNKERAQALRDRCLKGNTLNSSDQECVSLFGTEEDQKNMAKAAIKAEAETKAYLKRIESLRGADSETLKEFLIKHDLESFVDRVGSLGHDELIDIIKAKYKSDRKALIQNMNDRLHAIVNKNKTDDETNFRLASQRIDDLEDSKERVETLYRYTNIVSSYVNLDDGQGQVRANTAARNVEAEGFRRFAGESSSSEDFSSFFSSTQNQEASSPGNFFSTDSLIRNLGDFATPEMNNPANN